MTELVIAYSWSLCCKCLFWKFFYTYIQMQFNIQKRFIFFQQFSPMPWRAGYYVQPQVLSQMRLVNLVSWEIVVINSPPFIVFYLHFTSGRIKTNQPCTCPVLEPLWVSILYHNASHSSHFSWQSSSPSIFRDDFSPSDNSLTYTGKDSSPNTEPCGTPLIFPTQFQKAPLICFLCPLLFG